MIEKIKEYAKKNNIPIIMDESFEYINKYAREKNIKNILEIGTAIGYFACAISTDNDVFITTIEKNDKMYDAAVSNVNRCKLNDKVNIIHGDALEAELKNKYDLIFIDAAMGQYIKLFEKYQNNLNDKGVIICDNMNFHGYINDIENIESRNLRGLVVRTKRFREFLENNIEFYSEIINIGDGISISKRSDKNETVNNA